MNYDIQKPAESAIRAIIAKLEDMGCSNVDIRVQPELFYFRTSILCVYTDGRKLLATASGIQEAVGIIIKQINSQPTIELPR